MVSPSTNIPLCSMESTIRLIAARVNPIRLESSEREKGDILISSNILL
jgi:hypothetical protein